MNQNIELQNIASKNRENYLSTSGVAKGSYNSSLCSTAGTAPAIAAMSWTPSAWIEQNLQSSSSSCHQFGKFFKQNGCQLSSDNSRQGYSERAVYHLGYVSSGSAMQRRHYEIQTLVAH